MTKLGIVGIGALLGAKTVAVTGQAPPSGQPGTGAQGVHTAAAGACDKVCLNGIAEAYLAALIAHNWLSYITSIDLRRVWIADEEKGLVSGLTMFRQPREEKTLTLLNPDGTTTPRPMTNAPFDMEAAHIFKIQGGKLHDIEAMGFTLPLNSKNGWSDFTR